MSLNVSYFIPRVNLQIYNTIEVTSEQLNRDGEMRWEVAQRNVASSIIRLVTWRFQECTQDVAALNRLATPPSLSVTLYLPLPLSLSLSLSLSLPLS